MNLQSQERGSIKDICYKRFARGFSNEEIVKDLGYHKNTVSWYRKKLADEEEVNKYRESIPDHNNEMEYGLDSPTYKLEDLTHTEKALFKTIDHKQLRRWKA